MMTNNIYLKNVLSEAGSLPAQQLTLFALLNLGILDSLTSGVISATDARRIFFNAENCLFIHRHLQDRTADAIMRHGVQLPPAEAQREFQRELTKMRTFCLSLLEEKQVVA